jgi:hypothetical protein
VCTYRPLSSAAHSHSQAAAQRKIAEASSSRKGAQAKPTGRRSSGSASLPSSSTTASQGASSTSAAGSLQHPAAAPSTGAGSDSIVINIVPEFVPRSARPGRVSAAAAAAAAAGAGAPMSVGTATSSSSNAAGTLSSSSNSHGAGAPHSRDASSSASTARRMFTRLWKHQQQEVPEHVQGPSTASRSHERALRTGVTPLSSAAYSLSGSSSMAARTAGPSGHASAGVISSTHQPGAYGGAAAPSQGGQTVSSSSTGAGTSVSLSSHGLTQSSEGHSRTSAEIQPAPAKPLQGWLRRTSKQGRDVPDVVPGCDSGSSKTGSPAAPAKTESSPSGSQPDRDDLQVQLGCQGLCY